MKISTTATNSMTIHYSLIDIFFPTAIIHGMNKVSKFWYSKRRKEVVSRSKRLDRILGMTTIDGFIRNPIK